MHTNEAAGAAAVDERGSLSQQPSIQTWEPPLALERGRRRPSLLASVGVAAIVNKLVLKS
jgi:hypothetical protein